MPRPRRRCPPPFRRSPLHRPRQQHDSFDLPRRSPHRPRRIRSRRAPWRNCFFSPRWPPVRPSRHAQMARAQSRRLRHPRRRAPQRRSLHRRQPASRPRHANSAPRQIDPPRHQARPVHTRASLVRSQLTNIRAPLARRTRSPHAPRRPLHRFRRSPRIRSSPGIRLMPRSALAEAEAREQSSEHRRECGRPLALPSVTVEIGGIPIIPQPSDPEFCNVLESRYEPFAPRNAPGANDRSATPACRFEIHLHPRGRASDDDARVTREGPLWHFRRGDFDATWDPRAGHGRITQCPNPYSIDTVLRITHSLVLAEEGGFLLHAASAIRNNRAFLFAGVSGTGKTTMSRLAPPDATVLTDEISYIRRSGDRNYVAYGTPFAGELARVGANTSAPLQSLYLLVQGPENRIAPISKIAAARAIMRHVLFFAEEKELVAKIFDSVLEFVSRVNVAQLIFTPDARAWELIQ